MSGSPIPAAWYISQEKIDEQWNIAIAEVTIFSVLILPAFYCFYSHFKRNGYGWFFVITFCILQIVGSAITLSDGKGNFSASAGVISQIGLSPALLAGTLLLKECILNTPIAGEFIFGSLFESVEHVLIVAGVVLAAIGGNDTYSEPLTYPNGSPLQKAGTVLLLVLWLWLLVKCTLCAKQRNNMGQFITGPTSIFSPINGSIAGRVCLTFLPSILTVIAFLTGGVYTAPYAKSVGKGDGTTYSLPTSRAQPEARANQA